MSREQLTPTTASDVNTELPCKQVADTSTSTDIDIDLGNHTSDTFEARMYSYDPEFVSSVPDIFRSHLD